MSPSNLVKTGRTDDSPDRADLKALVDACQEGDMAKRKVRLDKLLDVNRFIDFAAFEVMTWHWDGYCMKANNYRVYHDPSTDKIVFFPHGMDQMFACGSERADHGPVAAWSHARYLKFRNGGSVITSASPSYARRCSYPTQCQAGSTTWPQS